MLFLTKCFQNLQISLLVVEKAPWKLFARIPMNMNVCHMRCCERIINTNPKHNSIGIYAEKKTHFHTRKKMNSPNGNALQIKSYVDADK